MNLDKLRKGLQIGSLTAAGQFYINTKQLTKVPTNILQIRDATQFLQHRNMGAIVVVGASALVKYLATTVSAFSKIQLKTCKTVDEALDIISKQIN